MMLISGKPLKQPRTRDQIKALHLASESFWGKVDLERELQKEILLFEV